MKVAVEQRRHPRFHVPALSAYVMLPSRPQSPMVGNIEDIGLGGMSFRCVAVNERPRRSSRMCILMPDRSFCLEDIPVRSVSSKKEFQDKGPAKITTRRCGVRFGELTTTQKSHLAYFIRKHTTADPEG
jgi:c-di-GMP-binding flagellar brake protein YcgR